MDVEPSREGLFNEVYDNEHVPLLLAVPASSPSRASSGRVTMIIAASVGRSSSMQSHGTAPSMSSRPGVLTARPGRRLSTRTLAGEVRPYTRNRRHVLYRRIS